MSDIPPNIDLDALAGPPRGKWPALYFRDEAVLAPGGAHVAIAYTIYEASMGNEVGRVLCVAVKDGNATILGNPPELLASCWRSPWCRWLDAETFVFKMQYVDEGRTRTPLLVIHVHRGFALVPETDQPEGWLDRAIPRNLRFEPLSGPALRDALHRAP